MSRGDVEIMDVRMVDGEGRQVIGRSTSKLIFCQMSQT